MRSNRCNFVSELRLLYSITVEVYLLIVELTKVIMCIVMLEADVITDVSRPGRFSNEQFIHEII